MELGDRNTKFFHRVATLRKTRNWIDVVQLEGTQILEHKEKAKVFFNHFVKLMGTNHSSTMDFDYESCGEQHHQLQYLKDAIFVQEIDQHSQGDGSDNVQNDSYIAFIPKKNGSFQLGDYRPISLINSVQKLFSKVVTMATNQKEQVGLFKADIFKAFDTLSWEFIERVLLAKGFPEEWVSKMVKKLVQLSLYRPPFKGCQPCLLFADDTIFFIEPTSRPVKFLKIILHIFEDLSGLGINLEKSEFLITAADETQVHNLARIMGCKPGVFPINYLGMPLSNKN
ncbi:uncharacterized protein LOC144563005 [Carex rostrata]